MTRPPHWHEDEPTAPRTADGAVKFLCAPNQLQIQNLRRCTFDRRRGLSASSRVPAGIGVPVHAPVIDLLPVEAPIFV